MPIFNGFDGEQFQFDGSPNKFFNLLTDKNTQVNVHFNSNKNIDAVGIKLGSPITYVKWLANNERAEINNKKFYSRSYFNFGSQNHLGYAEMKFQFESAPTCLKTNRFISCLFIDVGNYNFRIYKLENSFDLNIFIRNRNVRPHGIIGQTADFNGTARIPVGKQGEGIIEGNLLDYEVTDLWTNNFRYNKFKESA